MKLTKIIDSLEKWAPPIYQESYDNSGLMIGNKKNEKLKTITENLGIDIFPNPNNGRFYFSNYELIDKIMVYNNLGELVNEKSSCSSIEIKKKGIYLVKILNDKSEFFKKIVIN